MPVTASIQVAFGDEVAGADGHLSAEIDARADGLNSGDTSFAPGDTAYFLVYQSTNVIHDQPIASAGTITSVSSAETVDKEEDISFGDTDTASLSVPADSIQSVTWLGRSLGSLSLQDETTVKASASGVSVARVTYRTTAHSYGLESPESVAGLTDFSILVYILGHLVGSS